MLQAVVKEGTGVYALVLHRPVAAKTGTSNHGRDNLFIGYIGIASFFHIKITLPRFFYFSSLFP